jgi:hypothetical protein
MAPQWPAPPRPHSRAQVWDPAIAVSTVAHHSTTWRMQRRGLVGAAGAAPGGADGPAPGGGLDHPAARDAGAYVAGVQRGSARLVRAFLLDGLSFPVKAPGGGGPAATPAGTGTDTGTEGGRGRGRGRGRGHGRGRGGGRPPLRLLTEVTEAWAEAGRVRGLALWEPDKGGGWRTAKTEDDAMLAGLQLQARVRDARVARAVAAALSPPAAAGPGPGRREARDGPQGEQAGAEARALRAKRVALRAMARAPGAEWHKTRKLVRPTGREINHRKRSESPSRGTPGRAGGGSGSGRRLPRPRPRAGGPGGSAAFWTGGWC